MTDTKIIHHKNTKQKPKWQKFTIWVLETIAAVAFLAGISADTENFNVDPTVTSGVDIPFSSLITRTVRVNANFADDTDVGLILGVGVDFLELF